MAVAVNEPEPVRDTKLLTSRCCGANKFINGEDPVLKPDEEYPEWLVFCFIKGSAGRLYIKYIHTGCKKKIQTSILKKIWS